MGFPILVAAHNLQDHFLPFADHESVDEGRHRFRIVGGVAAGDDQRLFFRSFRAMQWNSGQIEQVEGIGIKRLVGQRDSQNIEFGNRVLALECVQRKVSLAHGRFHVGPGQVSAFGEYVRLLVEDVIENGQAQVGHAQIVDIRKGQGHACGDYGPLFHDLIQLTAGVAAGLLHRGQNVPQTVFNFGWVHAWIVPECGIWIIMVGIVTRRDDPTWAVFIDAAFAHMVESSPLPPSSSGPGRGPLKAETGVRNPVGAL